MRVTVLYGGPSAEREVSLVSGKAVIDGLKSMGHEVFASDVSPTDLAGLDHPADVIFPVLHGQFGESGELQEILEARKLAFVGSAEVSDKHANFIIAHPGCRADDVLKLVKIIQEKVWAKNEIHLESEVKIWP